jgi:hypothetical protein
MLGKGIHTQSKASGPPPQRGGGWQPTNGHVSGKGLKGSGAPLSKFSAQSPVFSKASAKVHAFSKASGGPKLVRPRVVPGNFARRSSRKGIRASTEVVEQMLDADFLD